MCRADLFGLTLSSADIAADTDLAIALDDARPSGEEPKRRDDANDPPKADCRLGLPLASILDNRFSWLLFRLLCPALPIDDAPATSPPRLRVSEAGSGLAGRSTTTPADTSTRRPRNKMARSSSRLRPDIDGKPVSLDSDEVRSSS